MAIFLVTATSMGSHVRPEFRMVTTARLSQLQYAGLATYGPKVGGLPGGLAPLNELYDKH